jgi:hypothetical protein
MKNDIYDLPDELLPEHNPETGMYSQNAFAHFDNYARTIENLARQVEDEDWSYQHSQNPNTFQYPILSNYVKYTYKRLAIEKKVAFSKSSDYACFDTGLVSKTQLEPVYAL